ncbi:MAG: calcium-binding protein [Snowella sp.]|nr:calcium-binding protein [Snowella sp.]
MPSFETDDTRETRIDYEIVVDAYDEQERAMGWYYYLEGKLNFPFLAKWTRKLRSSVREKQVRVVSMASEDECSHDMFVEVADLDSEDEDIFSAKLSEIEPIDADDDTQEAIADWHYWVDQGYEF